MTPEIKAKRREARDLLEAKRDQHLRAGQRGTADMYWGQMLRLSKGRYDDKLDDLIAGLKIGGEHA